MTPNIRLGYLAVPLDSFVRSHGDDLLATTIPIRNRDMPQLPAGLINPLCIVGGVH
ncbi:MAG: hypothetical protein WA133_14335 [Syntrophales bacterium]